MHPTCSDTDLLEHVLVEFQDAGGLAWVPVRAGHLATLYSGGKANDKVVKKFHEYEPVRIAGAQNMKLRSVSAVLVVQGQFVDVLDVYKDKVTQETRSKWRMAEVLRITPYQIQINYTGWPHDYDEWIDVLRNGNRVAYVSVRCAAAFV